MKIPVSPTPLSSTGQKNYYSLRNQLGMVLAMLPTWGYYVQRGALFTEASAFCLWKIPGRRFKQHPNLVWVSGRRPHPYRREAEYRALAHGLRAGDGGAHLITYHPCGWRHSSQFWQNEDWLDFNMIETWTAWPGRVRGRARRLWPVASQAGGVGRSAL